MMRFCTAVAVAFFAVLALAGCNDYGNTFQGNTGVGLAFVSPSNISAGGPDLTISLTAVGGNSNFVVQTMVTWDQKPLSTCVVTSDSGTGCAAANDTGTVVTVTAVVPAALTAKPGTHFVQTIQPHSGAGTNGLSNPIAFTVNPPSNPTPAITSISPTSTPACGTSCATDSVALTINGSGFLPSSGTPATNCVGSAGASIPCVSQVNWNLGSTQVTFTTANTSSLAITTTSIQLTVPGQITVTNQNNQPQTIPILATAGTATVTVFNPPAPPPQNCVVNCTGYGGGGTSPCPLVMGSTTVTVCTFTVTDPASSANAKSAAVQEETPAVSSDGRYVAYTASQDGHTQIFARDTCLGGDSSCQPRTVLISSTLEETAGSEDSHAPSMSSDGRYVAFSSAATNLTSDAATLTGRQVFLRDTCFGVSGPCTPSTQLISVDPNGALGGTEAILPSVSTSGRFVAFLAVTLSNAKADKTKSKSAATSPNSGLRQVFVRDTCLGAKNCTPSTTRISQQPGDGAETTTKPAGPALSGTAHHVALAIGNASTLLSRSIPVDDGVFLAFTNKQP